MNRCDCNKRIKRELSLPFYIIANLLLYGMNNALLVDRISSSSLLWFPIGVCSSSCYVRLRNLILSRRKSELSASYPGALGVLSVFAFLEKCLWVSCELFCGGRIIVRICFCKCFGWFSYWFLDFHMRDKGNENSNIVKSFNESGEKICGSYERWWIYLFGNFFIYTQVLRGNSHSWKKQNWRSPKLTPNFKCFSKVLNE